MDVKEEQGDTDADVGTEGKEITIHDPKSFNLGKHEKNKEFDPKVIMEQLVVDESNDRRLVALEWSQDYHNDRVLIAA